MSVFCPDGYVPTREGVVRAALYFFPDQIAALEKAPAAGSETKTDNFADAVARAFSRSKVLNTLRREFRDIVNQTVHRLRNFLHQGELNAYYFAKDGRHSVPPEFWATTVADGVMESGIYWPLGWAIHERRPNYSLLLEKSELNGLLSNQPAKRPFPPARKWELVGALQKLDRFSRPEQLNELRTRFPEFKITERLFREAAKHAGRRSAGRKSRR